MWSADIPGRLVIPGGGPDRVQEVSLRMYRNPQRPERQELTASPC